MDTYLGYDVFSMLLGPTEQNQITNKLKVIGDIQNYRETVVHKETDSRLSFTTYQANFAERSSLRTFFKGKKGKLLPFWYLSPVHIGTIIEDVSAGVSFRMEETGLRRKDQTQAMFIYIPDVQIYTQVLSVTSDDHEDLGRYEDIVTTYDFITSPLSVGTKVYSILFGRFDQDTLTFDFIDNNVSTASITFKELQADLQHLIS
ncbi:MAG: hypothetical protein U9N61_11915 [Euryarchaeota archaeon]|nr:hypothetical protein [Euryarchaeota archaeon]